MSNVLFVEYPKCSTCKKAKNYLDEKGVSYTSRHIVEDNPTVEDLKEWHRLSGLPIRRFFNTSGMLYRERNLKTVLDAGATDEECYEILAENGMLVKRPILVTETTAIPGFREATWEEALN